MKTTILLTIMILAVNITFAGRKTAADSFANTINDGTKSSINTLSLYPELGTHNLIAVHPNTTNATIIFTNNSGKVVRIIPLKDNTNSTNINCKELLPGTYRATWRSGTKFRHTNLVIEEVLVAEE